MQYAHNCIIVCVDKKRFQIDYLGVRHARARPGVAPCAVRAGGRSGLVAVFLSGRIDNQERMTQPEKELPPGLICLCVVAAHYQIAVNPAQLAHIAGGGQDFSSDDILSSAKLLNFKARVARFRLDQFATLPVPAIAEVAGLGHILISKIQDGKVIYIDPANAQSPQIAGVAEFHAACDGRVLLFRPGQAGGDEHASFGLGWFVSAVLKYRTALAEIFIAAFFIQLFALATPLFVQLIIDKVLLHGNVDTLNVLACGMLIVILFEMIFVALQGYILAHTSNRVDALLGAKVVRHLLRIPLRYFENRRVGDTVARVRELENVRQFITGSSITAILDGVFVLVFLLAMFYYSKELTLLTMTAIPLLIGLTLIVRSMMRKRLNHRFNCGADSNSFLIEAVTGIHTLKALAAEPQMQRKWEVLLAKYSSATFSTGTLGAFGGALGQGIERCIGLLVLWLGASLVMQGKLSVGQLIAFQMLSGRVTHPIVRIIELWQGFQQVAVSVERLGDLMNTKPEVLALGGKVAPRLHGHVRLEKLSFRYELGGKEVLSDLSLDVAAGTTVGIVGRSGSGKSTLAKLLQSLYVPQGGRILIDGLDVQQFDLGLLRRHIGVVLQENFLFNGTIAENIATQAPHAPFEAIVEAARLAGADEFICELPDAYQTKVGERGVALSGGQRQRVAIARALLGNPSILIFDEATSALDYESERIIQRNLDKICQGRTVFIIAHRLSTIRHADQIVVLDGGALREQGSHAELIAAGGIYAHLYSLQAGSGHE
ncbi:peptidase domain-containing ABC transporter [Rugamonas sp. CCM 8940]|uniref:peptidase domain-containing ABC transporter n=1 Tax=Rugamonas sp. CCM 8940 TaxID=2765359 RepID=UPI0018F667C6|nr:peptidase domain-containing ABC transporter [Rugamonas sp. CCM 8940]MBJ7308921.1 peptidase domain-containing ABC transporter [Rugamonas sp. CCM 8940]